MARPTFGERSEDMNLDDETAERIARKKGRE